MPRCRIETLRPYSFSSFSLFASLNQSDVLRISCLLEAVATFRLSYSQFGADLKQEGALIPVSLTAPSQWVLYLQENDFPPFAVRSGYALIDTGADRSAVDASVMSDLGIPPVGTEPFLTAHGIADLQLYNLSVVFPDLSDRLISSEEAPGGSVQVTPPFSSNT